MQGGGQCFVVGQGVGFGKGQWGMYGVGDCGDNVQYS